jgi:hypothetical protein
MLKDDIQALSRSKQIKCESYCYTATFNTLLAGPAVQTNVNVNISNDSDFVILATCMVAYTAPSVLLVAPDYVMLLLDTSSGRLLMDIPVHVSNVTGTGQWPYVWPEPYLLKGGGTLSCLLINNTAVAAVVTVTFIGYKVFYLQDYRR